MSSPPALCGLERTGSNGMRSRRASCRPPNRHSEGQPFLAPVFPWRPDALRLLGLGHVAKDVMILAVGPVLALPWQSAEQVGAISADRPAAHPRLQIQERDVESPGRTR